MRILVTGASGLLGLNFCLSMAERHTITGITHTHALNNPPFGNLRADLVDQEMMRKLILENKPEMVLNCAAMANVDDCEKNQRAAQATNADLPGNIAVICHEENIKLVHISTDAVFDGKMGDYSEEDEPHPLSVYASTKLEGEEKVLKNNPQALVARVNFYGFSLGGKRSLAEFFLNNLREKRQVNGFVDVMFCPLYTPHLAEILMAMVEKDLKGIYHVVSPECLSKYAFGTRIARKFGFDTNLIQPVSVTEGGLTAMRSPKISLNIEKLQAEKIEPPSQDCGIDQFYQDYLAGVPQKILSFAV